MSELEVAMEESFVWITTRRIKPGSLEKFERAWRPERHPGGMHHAYAYWTEDGQEVTGVSFWDSQESCDTWRASAEESRRRAAMAPYVTDEREAFFRGSPLALPKP
jgi:heme-degrading monooxygenase HmoA